MERPGRRPRLFSEPAAWSAMAVEDVGAGRSRQAAGDLQRPPTGTPTTFLGHPEGELAIFAAGPA